MRPAPAQSGCSRWISQPAKGAFQKPLQKWFQLCLFALGTLFLLTEKSPSSQWVLCCHPAVLQSASPAGYQLGKGFATPVSPCHGGTCGWSPASGHSPVSQQTELILLLAQRRCIFERTLLNRLKKCVHGVILQLLFPPCLNILMFNRSSSVCKNLVL